MAEENEVVRIIDLVVGGGSGSNFRTVFLANSVVKIDVGGEQAFQFTTPDTSIDFQAMVPVKEKNIVTLFSYLPSDPNAPQPTTTIEEPSA